LVTETLRAATRKQRRVKEIQAMIYQLAEAERVKSIAEQREYDVRRGELAATMTRSVRSVRQRTHAIVGVRRVKRPASSCAAQLQQAD
jgi:hypothetical protein